MQCAFLSSTLLFRLPGGNKDINKTLSCYCGSVRQWWRSYRSEAWCSERASSLCQQHASGTGQLGTNKPNDENFFLKFREAAVWGDLYSHRPYKYGQAGHGLLNLNWPETIEKFIGLERSHPCLPILREESGCTWIQEGWWDNNTAHGSSSLDIMKNVFTYQIISSPTVNSWQLEENSVPEDSHQLVGSAPVQQLSSQQHWSWPQSQRSSLDKRPSRKQPQGQVLPR